VSGAKVGSAGEGSKVGGAGGGAKAGADGADDGPPDWSSLDAQLAAHQSADEKEAHDVAAIRAFLKAWPEDAHLRTQLLGHLTGSSFVLDDLREKVLLLHHKRLDRWLQPGGHGDGETTPLAIALRELEEETGLGPGDVSALDGGPPQKAKLFDVDIHPIPGRMHEPAHEHLDLRYAFVARKGAEPRLSSESRALAWLPLETLPPQADQALRRALAKLARAAGFEKKR
jgi:8-oxo-dGTP pyrophosphatase MutT (NUDIX family)